MTRLTATHGIAPVAALDGETLRELLTTSWHGAAPAMAARTLRHPAWTEIRRNTHPTNTIQFRLQKFNAT
jgi:hypothetical protein